MGAVVGLLALMTASPAEACSMACPEWVEAAPESGSQFAPIDTSIGVSTHGMHNERLDPAGFVLVELLTSDRVPITVDEHGVHAFVVHPDGLLKPLTAYTLVQMREEEVDRVLTAFTTGQRLSNQFSEAFVSTSRAMSRDSTSCPTVNRVEVRANRGHGMFVEADHGLIEVQITAGASFDDGASYFTAAGHVVAGSGGCEPGIPDLEWRSPLRVRTRVWGREAGPWVVEDVVPATGCSTLVMHSSAWALVGLLLFARRRRRR